MRLYQRENGETSGVERVNVTRKAMGGEKWLSEALFVQDSFAVCSIVSIGPLSGVTQACRTFLGWHQFSRPIRVIITCEQ